MDAMFAVMNTVGRGSAGVVPFDGVYVSSGPSEATSR